MREFKFNYCLPREYKDQESGDIKYCLCRGGEKMNIDTLENIQHEIKTDLPKEGAPWCQVFNNGYRVTRDNLDWSDWTGFTFADIDSKYFYKYEKRFDVDLLLETIVKNAPYLYNYNYYGAHLTNSKQSYRIFWFWDCERTEENFKKCCVLTDQYTRKLFYSFGDNAKQIIDYQKDGHRVLDRCSKSILQGFYITSNKIYYNDFIDDKDFGYVELDDIELEDIYKVGNAVPIYNNKAQHENIQYSGKRGVDKSSIRYYPHHHRRCIYEALIVLFNDKSKVDEEWKYICEMLPETDGMENGHDRKFYLREPDKNRWFEKFNKGEIHKLDWLDVFGYNYTDNTEYIYIKQFKRSWRKHVWLKLLYLYMDFKKTEYLKTHDMKVYKELKNELENEWIEDFKAHDIFGDYFDNILDEETCEKFNDYRSEYFKRKWEAKDFKYLCEGYDIPKDIVTYKMYADFYYRDKNGLPTIKYNILEDDIQVLGYWPETNRIQYHTFKYNDEYTHWKNNDTFNNACNANDLLKSVNKYTARWHNYHIIKDYLNSLDLGKTDEDLLETWAIRYFDCEDTKLTREICKKFFIAAVKKQMIEDVTSFVFQHMLFLQGATGCGKTFFLINMFTINGHSYILNKIDPNGKDNEIGPLIAKNWLIQFGESESLKKVSVNAAKEFIDRINLGMKYQKKFENEQTTIYPRIMACRTSNDDVLFNDISISEGDRRNWLLICRTGINACDEHLREQMIKDKDIIWATAYKLYLDDPDQDLELSNEAFSELARIQEEYKLIPSSDIEELYDEIFNRKYLTNYKCEIKDELSFMEMLKHSDIDLNNSSYYADIIQENSFSQENMINKIPAKWLSNYVKNKYGISHMKLLKKYMLEHGWKFKQAGYLKGTIKCFINERA